MRRSLKKLIVLVMAMVMTFAMGITVLADGEHVAAVKAIKAKPAATVYTNGATDVTISYTWDKIKGGVEQSAPAALKADSNNKGVVKVESILVGETSISKNGKVATTTATLKLDAIANGKAKVTVTDAYGKKKKAITVTVKTWAEDIAVSGNTIAVDADGNCTVTVANAKNAKVNLGAYITNANASNKKIKYSVVEKKTGVSVDAKGNVKFAKENPSDATIKVKSADGKVEKLVKVVKGDKVEKVTIIQDTKKNVNTPGLLNGKNVLNMKGNKTSSAYTYQLDWKENVEAKALSFVSSKPAVASVDANGKITAKGNGTAKITVSPKYNNALASKVITVKVKTDVENISVAADEFTIIANGKATANINAKTNANASNKAITYKVFGVTETDGTPVAANKIKKYVSVNNKGVVKMKRAAIATIDITAKGNSNVKRMVTVTGVVPVSGITLETVSGSEATLNKKVYTVYRTSADTAQKLEFTAKISNDDATNKAVKWNSSKTAVAEVVNGKVIAKANGTTVITATAADGSGKKATAKVTVKTDAYEINVAKAQPVSGNAVVYVEGKADVAKKYNLAKVIAAKTNTDASKKTITYTVSGNAAPSKDVKLKAGEIADIIVKADKAELMVKLACISADEAAKKEAEVEITGTEEILLTVGGSTKPVFTVTSKDGKIVVDPTAVKLTTSNKNVVAVKNGTLTAKKEGIATITATYAEAKTTATVYVGRNTAAIEKELEKIATAKLKAENYDYLGVKTKFDAKKNAFTLDIINPANDINNIEGTGLVAFAKEMYLNKKDTLGCNTIEITVDGITWIAENDMNGFGNAYRVENGVKEAVLTHAGMQEAIDYVVDSVIGDATQLKDWNGKECTVVFNFTDTSAKADNKVFDHTVTYNVTSKMNSKLYEATVDAAVAEALSINVEGIDFTFDEASNAIEILVTDVNNTSIADADAASRADVVAALEKVFADAETVTLNAKVYTEIATGVAPVNETVTKTNNGQSVEFINDMLDEYIAKLANNGVVTLADLNGVVMSADITFAAGSQKYTYTYTADAIVDEVVFDAAADKKINDAVAANKDAFTSGTVTYAAENNALDVVFNSSVSGNTIAGFEGEGFKSILDAVISGSDAVSAVVITDKASTPITLDAESGEDAYAVLAALVGDAKTVADLDGKAATIKVVYAAENGASQKTLAYKITFDVAQAAPVSTQDVTAPAEEVTEETVTEVEA